MSLLVNVEGFEREEQQIREVVNRNGEIRRSHDETIVIETNQQFFVLSPTKEKEKEIYTKFISKWTNLNKNFYFSLLHLPSSIPSDLQKILLEKRNQQPTSQEQVVSSKSLDNQNKTSPNEKNDQEILFLRSDIEKRKEEEKRLYLTIENMKTQVQLEKQRSDTNSTLLNKEKLEHHTLQEQYSNLESKMNENFRKQIEGNF